MAGQLKALATLPEHWDSICSTHMKTYNSNSSPRGSGLFWPPLELYVHGAQTYIQANTHCICIYVHI